MSPEQYAGTFVRNTPIRETGDYTGQNPLAKASIDQWLEAEGQGCNPPTSTLVFQLAFAPKDKDQAKPGTDQTERRQTC
ncbi:glutathione S-transferase-like [Quillaja saponaria]|uniref:Glutathione S-transferase-like n=1 Tax=Quillaja saponaria TaxID=32244 RepID=A0AAD7Q0Y8_QUISA|nr:glutathione S-transferase-like [Quillaja saponaria]